VPGRSQLLAGTVNLPSSWRRIGARWPYLPAGAQCRADVWLDQAVANRDRDQAHLENAKIDLNRYTELAKEHSIATQLAESQKAIVDQIVAMIKADEAIIESAGVNLSYTNLTSPIDGVTGIRQIDIGNIIHPTDVNGLVDVTQVEPISLIFTLPEANFVPIQELLSHGPVMTPPKSWDH
jgi:membrane fusion protein, multidrug efflux system